MAAKSRPESIHSVFSNDSAISRVPEKQSKRHQKFLSKLFRSDSKRSTTAILDTEISGYGEKAPEEPFMEPRVSGSSDDSRRSIGSHHSSLSFSFRSKPASPRRHKKTPSSPRMSGSDISLPLHASYESIVEHIQSMVDESGAQSKSLHEELKRLGALLEEENCRSVSLMSENSTLQTQVFGLQKQRDRDQQRMSEIQKELDQTQKELDAALLEHEETRSQMTRFEIQNVQLLKRVQDLTESSEKETIYLHKKIDMLKDEEHRYATKLKEEISFLEDRVRDLETSLTEKNQAADKLKKEHESEIESHQRARNSIQHKLDDLVASYEELQKEKNSSESKYLKLEEDLIVLKGRLHAVEEENHHLLDVNNSFSDSRVLRLPKDLIVSPPAKSLADELEVHLSAPQENQNNLIEQVRQLEDENQTLMAYTDRILSKVMEHVPNHIVEKILGRE